MMTDLTKLKELIYNNLDIIMSNLDIELEEFEDNYYCNCPIHDGSDNPRGFSYSKKTNSWKCWTHGCHEEYKTDIFGLICGVLSKQRKQRVSFGHCLGWATKVLNIDSKTINTEEVKKSCGVDNISSILKTFNKTVETPEDPTGTRWETDIPSNYFKGRGFSEEVLRTFEVGDCQDRSSYMKFRSVMPIYNHDGSKMVGSIGRRYLEYIEPKFIIDKGFNKSNYLYNFHRAVEMAKKTSTLFLVEGQGDVWRMWECGVKNVVGIFGKELSQNQISLINSLGITRLVILLDHDQPGREAKIKMKRDLDRYFSLYFPNVNTKRDIGQMPPKDLEEKILSKFKGLY